MGGKTKIEWTRGDDGSAGMSWNPVRGCTKISPGCKHCYAETFAERFRGVPGHPYEQGFDPRLAPDKLDEPLHWKKPRRVFVNSMSDLFHKDFSNEYIAAVFGVMAACPQHTFQVLTKRAERLPEWFAWVNRFGRSPLGELHGGYGQFVPGPDVVEDGSPEDERELDIAERILDAEWPLRNVWIGVSVEYQERADERIPHLLRTPAAIRFLSCEPMLGPVELARYLPGWGPDALIGWVIVGGESGGGARTCDLAWLRSIVEQCRSADVPVFVKQLGSLPLGEVGFRVGDRKGGDMAEWPEDLRVRQFPEVHRAD